MYIQSGIEIVKDFIKWGFKFVDYYLNGSDCQPQHGPQSDTVQLSQVDSDLDNQGDISLDRQLNSSMSKQDITIREQQTAVNLNQGDSSMKADDTTIKKQNNQLDNCADIDFSNSLKTPILKKTILKKKNRNKEKRQ